VIEGMAGEGRSSERRGEGNGHLITSFVISLQVLPRSSVCSIVPESPTAQAVSSCASYPTPECVFSSFIEMLFKCTDVGDSIFSHDAPPSTVLRMRP
jgi:hypothetical protein